MTEFVVNDTRSDMRLLLSSLVQVPDTEGFYRFRAKLCGAGIEAECRVEDYNSGHWAPFFADMANRWKGWSGAIRHETYNECFVLTATSDSLGHIALSVSLRNDIGPEWHSNFTFALEAGQLEGIALSASHFFGAGGK